MATAEASIGNGMVAHSPMTVGIGRDADRVEARPAIYPLDIRVKFHVRNKEEFDHLNAAYHRLLRAIRFDTTKNREPMNAIIQFVDQQEIHINLSGGKWDDFAIDDITVHFPPVANALVFTIGTQKYRLVRS